MKSVISIVAFTVTFGFSVGLIGLLFGFPQANIERLINQDINNGEFRNFEIRQVDSYNKLTISEYTESINNYVDKSESMDDSDLPADFQAAWRSHMKAWRDYSNFLNEMRESSYKMNDSEFKKHESEFNLQINRTWYQTLRIGRSYGASFQL
jgi:hypothetical protein